MNITYLRLISGMMIFFSCILFVQAQTQPAPGGIDMATKGYILDLWVDGDHSTDTSWDNIIPAAYTLVKKSTNAPVTQISRFNFHKELYFGNIAGSKLFMSSNYNLVRGDSYYVFVVSDASSAGTTDAVLLTFNSNATNTSLRWNNSGSTNILSSYWTTTQRSPNFTSDNQQRYGIATMNIVNSNSSPFQLYLNGTQYSTTLSNGNNSSGSAQYNVPLLIGNASNSTGTGSTSPFNGTIQEIILIRKSSASMLMPDADLAKIHSYLAIKYGITLKSGNYISSDNTVVWDRTADNALYNNDIFGIARDDNSILCQRQGRSVSSNLLTAYLGNSLPELNSLNTGTIMNDKTYLIFGSEGGSSVQQLTGIGSNEVFENGSISMPDNPNIQSPVYRTQLTGEASITVNLKIAMSDYSYVLVSNDPGFPAGDNGTRFYPVVDYIAQNIEIDQEYKYIKLIGFAPGPGGVTEGLRLWLRADELPSLTIENRPASEAQTTNSNLNGYSLPANFTGTVSAVSAWSDLVRGQTYSYAAGPTTGSAGTNHRIPVLKRNSPEMNYHPAVHFWGSEDSYASYLSNAATNIMPWARPADGKHTAYFMVNNDFSTNSWIYMLTFGSTATGTIPYPGYGIQKLTSGTFNGNITGRFRADGNKTLASLNLFNPGMTSILGYQTRTGTSGTTNYSYFRFNGKEDNSSTASASGDREFNWNNVNFQTPSMLGSGYSYNRTMQGVMSEVILYDRQLDDPDTQKLESYLAFKYGVTLYPSNTGTNRFNYTLANGTVVWEGDTYPGKYADFYHNISAVIRDDAARLHNRHSHSTNIGSILHIGVAGTRLSDDGSETGRLENDQEAVVSGNDEALGNTHISDPDACGDFTDRFNRKWLIHKVTRNDRPVTMLVGAQHNEELTIGNDADVVNDYYSKLGPGYDVYMIAGKSPADIDAGIYRAVVPMSYINGEHQCSYTFTEEDTYITFGWRLNSKGCTSDKDAVFSGVKKFDWTQWTSATNTSTATGLILPATPFPPVDLGDNIHVVSTQVSYPPNVKANRRYPRSVNIPARGSLEVQRRGGPVNQDVVITVEFDHPVIPEFSISDLDSHRTSYEEVEIYGECSGSVYLPVLSYAASPSAAGYKINGNKATVTKKGNVAGSNKNGMLNVAFQGGVTSITIKYRTKIAAYGATQNIYISPVTLRSVPPPSPINEDGLSFVKQVKEPEVTTCDPVEYSFYIENTNCDSKVVNFSDILPENMKWEAGSFGLDAAGSELNPAFDPRVSPATSGNGEKLQIDGLVVPGQATLILTATAIFEEDAPGAKYSNRASITYEKIVNNNPVQVPPFYSLDKEMLEPYTSFNAIWQQHQDQATMVPAYSRTTYSAGSEIMVTYTITNTNADITDMYLDVGFNEEFTLVDNSLQITQVSGSANTPVPVPVVQDSGDPASLLSIAGNPDGSAGFVLPTGVMEIKFTLKAPVLDNIQNEPDDAGQPTGKKVDLDIGYGFSSGMADPCIQAAIKGLHGNKVIPYSAITHIITNRNTTVKILK